MRYTWVRAWLGIMAFAAACGDDSGSAPSSPAPDGAQAPARSAQAVQIDTADAAQREQWPAVRTRLQACEPLSVQVLYSFGSARLEPEGAAEGCRIRIETRGELAEQDEPEFRYRCTPEVLSLPWIQRDWESEVRDLPPDAELEQSSACERL